MVFDIFIKYYKLLVLVYDITATKLSLLKFLYSTLVIMFNFFMNTFVLFIFENIYVYLCILLLVQ